MGILRVMGVLVIWGNVEGYMVGYGGCGLWGSCGNGDEGDKWGGEVDMGDNGIWGIMVV